MYNASAGFIKHSHFTDALTAWQLTQHSCSLAFRVMQQAPVHAEAPCPTLQVAMVTVAQFIDSIERLEAGSKVTLKSHVQTTAFGTSLDAECDDLVKETLQADLPASFSAMDRTAVTRTLRRLGEYLNRRLWVYVLADSFLADFFWQKLICLPVYNSA